MLGVDSGVPIRRALLSVDPRVTPTEVVDVLVVGSGIAGLTVASSLPPGMTVAVATKGRLRDGSTWHAQGGVAASLGEDDTPDLHHTDTLVAGSGLCDTGAVRVLVDDAAGAVGFLERSGLRLDRDGAGRALTREGGHSRNRVVHAGGDATGAAIVRALVGTIGRLGLRTYEESFCADLLCDENGAIAGAVLISPDGVRVVRCGTIVLASGGYGQLFAETTSPVTCTGDGTAAALRAGAHLADLEFVQFHPTTVHIDRDPRPLISEAMRGEGAVLRDPSGASVTGGHPLGDLAPRDIVSRAMVARMVALGTDHLFLDATGFDTALLERRFPTIVASTRALGIDPATQWIPVSPAAHYTMGGISTDVDGRTNLEGLFAVGEVAASGVHGANRLASNSLLEGVVFGRRVADAIADAPIDRTAPEPLEAEDAGAYGVREDRLRPWLRRMMVLDAGVIRSAEGLGSLVEEVTARLEHPLDGSIAGFETENLLEVATGLALAANAREESRGAHFRTDFPHERESWMRHQVVVRGVHGTIELRRTPVGATSFAVEGPVEVAAAG
jgi:L-aspartate oxidase